MTIRMICAAPGIEDVEQWIRAMRWQKVTSKLRINSEICLITSTGMSATLQALPALTLVMYGTTRLLVKSAWLSRFAGLRASPRM